MRVCISPEPFNTFEENMIIYSRHFHGDISLLLFILSHRPLSVGIRQSDNHRKPEKLRRMLLFPGQ